MYMYNVYKYICTLYMIAIDGLAEPRNNDCLFQKYPMPFYNPS